MPETFDLVVLGGGHNGLVTAALFAKAGWSVCVLERRHNIGGGCCTEEVTLPGFRHNLHSQGHVYITGGPVFKSLELDKFGCQYVFPDPTCACVFKDGRSIVFYRDLKATCETIAQFSKKDAEAYRQMVNNFEPLNRLFVASWYQPPLPPSKIYAAFEKSPGGLELLQMWNASCQDIVNEYFESDQLKIAVLLMAMQGANLADLYGVGAYVPILCSGMHSKPYGLCVGGSRYLAEAIARCLEANGGVIRKNASVDRILIEKGEAKGVRLDDGTEIFARRAVASNTNVKTLMLRHVGEEHLEANFLRRVRAYKPDEVTPFTPHYALSEPPRYLASEKNPDVQKAMFVSWGCEDMGAFARHAGDVRSGRLPQDVTGFSIAPSVHDPSQAPPGKHTAFVWQYACYHLAGGAGKWDAVKEEYADYVEGVWRGYAPNMAGTNILKRFVYTPLEIERTNMAMFEGSFHHGLCSPNQMGSFRPFAGWSHYRMPIKKLYLCGSSSHPAGGVTGAPGFNCAGVIADDAQTKKWWWRASKSLA
ncbi:MAG: NAD(P)/FAD-dependent oxidoreductase [Candidatus Tectomicrobia bacterium]|nr:NAD(P)/FAD-dependent oxidoreductase [Candidatus Tectomicrobia bacterium]